MTDIEKKALVKQMAERFLGWRLPENFQPDAGIKFTPVENRGTPYEYRHRPTGTNLFCYEQAKAMVEYMIEGVLLSGDDEAFRREVSDALKDYFGASVGAVAKGFLGQFIIPDAVDPLVEALKTSDPERDDEWDYSPYADALRTAMKARGYAFTKIEEGQP